MLIDMNGKWVDKVAFLFGNGVALQHQINLILGKENRRFKSLKVVKNENSRETEAYLVFMEWIKSQENDKEEQQNDI